MDLREISVILKSRAEEIARHLLPLGKMESGNWVCGDISGGEGKSLKVCLSGEEAGLFYDFAETESKGDIIDLWRMSKGQSLGEAIREIKDYLGIKDMDRTSLKMSNKVRPVSLEYPKNCFPVSGKKEVESKVKATPLPNGANSIKKEMGENDPFTYLTNTRKISESTLSLFKIKNVKGDIAFPFYFPDQNYKENPERTVLVNLKYLAVSRVSGKKKIWQTKDGLPCLFGWQAMPSDARSCVITEGEIDAMSMAEYGFNALSLPIGAGGGKKLDFIENEFANLERFETIYICLDNDPSGLSTIKELCERLGNHRCKIVSLPMKDANECLQSNVPVEEIVRCIKESRMVDPETLSRVADFSEALFDEFFPGSLSRSKGYTSIWESWGNDKVRFRPAEVSIWTGVNGHGKSQFIGNLMLDAMNGGEKFCIASMEIKPSRLLKRLAIQILATKEVREEDLGPVTNWLNDRLWIYNVVGTTSSKDLLEVFAYARKRYGVTSFVIDSLMKCGMAEDDYNKQKVFVDSLTDFAKEHNSHVHLVAHPKKLENESSVPGKMAIRGAGVITDLVDNCFCVWRNKEKGIKVSEIMDSSDYSESQKMTELNKIVNLPDAKVFCDKQRFGEWEGVINLFFDSENSFRFTDYPYWKTPAKPFNIPGITKKIEEIDF